jgi:integrase
MASTGPGDEPGRDVEPVIAAGLPPQPLPEVPAILLAGARVERLIAGFLLGYRDRTRAAYLADLRDFGAWCDDVGIGLLSVHRTHVQAYVRHLEHAGRSRATVARRLATLAGFYRYAVQERTLPHSPVTHVRRPSARSRATCKRSPGSGAWSGSGRPT